MAAMIAVGYDGSTSARSALRWALDEAAVRGADLRVVTVVEGTPPASLWGVPAPPRISDEELDLARTRVSEAVHEVTQERPDVDTDVVVLPGHPSAVLIQQSGDAALLVVGSNGLGGLARTLLGSVSTAVATHAHCPVTIVR